MKVAIGADHGGIEIKKVILKTFLFEKSARKSLVNKYMGVEMTVPAKNA